MNLKKILLAAIAFVALVSTADAQTKENSFQVEKIGNGKQNILFIPGFASSGNIQEKQRNIQSRFMNVYFSLLSIGILIYLYEFCLRMSYGMAIITYSLTLGWLLFVWLYLKPRIVKKQNRELQGYIDSIHKIIESEND